MNSSRSAHDPTLDDFRGHWIEGTGDRAVLEAIDAAYESTQPSAGMACLPLLYKRDWDGFVEGPPWPAWWIQNSFGASYGLMPFLGEPYATWMEHSQGLWFRLMGDGRRNDGNGFQGPDGCLCDAAFAMMNGGAKRGFGDFRIPDGGVEQIADGTIHHENIWYRQGDGDPKQYDWFIGATAAGLIMEADRLLVRHDRAGAEERLPELERVAAFLDSRRDPGTNLVKGGMASNLLAPSFSGSRNPDGTYGQAFLAELSINTIAGLERLAEVCILCGHDTSAARYRETAILLRKALPQLMTQDGYFIMSEDPDGTRHGIVGAAKHGYFEATPNHDAGCFGVTDDDSNRKIVRYMLSLKGEAAPGGLAPHGLILPNYPSYDDSIHSGSYGLRYGDWVNGGHWSTTQGRMSVACLRAGEFAHPFGAWARIRALMEGYRADAPLAGFGQVPWEDKQKAPYCVVYDCWGVPGGLLRGLFEYDYRADLLRVRPHLPASVTRYVQKCPVYFGKTKIYLTVTGTGDCGWTEIRPNGEPGSLAVELVRGNAKPLGAWMPTAPDTIEAAALKPTAIHEEVDFKQVAKFYQALDKAGLKDSYEASCARTALELLACGETRRTAAPALPELDNITPCGPKAVETLYADTAAFIVGGLLDRLTGKSLWAQPVAPEILHIARQVLEVTVTLPAKTTAVHRLERPSPEQDGVS
jgi:hypothetical protein